jgi:hypothetical protein
MMKEVTDNMFRKHNIRLIRKQNERPAADMLGAWIADTIDTLPTMAKDGAEPLSYDLGRSIVNVFISVTLNPR